MTDTMHHLSKPIPKLGERGDIHCLSTAKLVHANVLQVIATQGACGIRNLLPCRSNVMSLKQIGELQESLVSSHGDEKREGKLTRHQEISLSCSWKRSCFRSKPAEDSHWFSLVITINGRETRLSITVCRTVPASRYSTFTPNAHWASIKRVPWRKRRSGKRAEPSRFIVC